MCDKVARPSFSILGHEGKSLLDYENLESEDFVTDFLEEFDLESKAEQSAMVWSFDSELIALNLNKYSLENGISSLLDLEESIRTSTIAVTFVTLDEFEDAKEC